jgi:hypothetical protein
VLVRVEVRPVSGRQVAAVVRLDEAAPDVLPVRLVVELQCSIKQQPELGR